MHGHNGENAKAAPEDVKCEWVLAQIHRLVVVNFDKPVVVVIVSVGNKHHGQ